MILKKVLVIGMYLFLSLIGTGTYFLQMDTSFKYLTTGALAIAYVMNLIYDFSQKSNIAVYITAVIFLVLSMFLLFIPV